MKDLADLGVTGSREHVEQCLDETETADQTAKDRRDVMHAGVKTGSDRSPPALFVPGPCSRDVPMLSVDAVESEPERVELNDEGQDSCSVYEPGRKLDLDTATGGGGGAAGRCTTKPTAYMGVRFCFGCGRFLSGDAPTVGKG